MSDPRAVLGEYGMNVPDGIDVNVVESSDSAVHINLPTPPVGHAELSDEDLDAAAGGTPVALCGTIGCTGKDQGCS